MPDPTFTFETDEFEPEFGRRIAGPRPPFRPVRPRRPRPPRRPRWRVPRVIAYPIPIVDEPVYPVEPEPQDGAPSSVEPSDQPIEPADQQTEPGDQQEGTFSRKYNVPIIGDRSGFQELDAELEKGIIGDDNRKAVTDTKKAPYRFICHLLVEQKALVDASVRTVTGTGVLISNSHVLTCGHILRESGGGKTYVAQRVVVTPGKNTMRNTDFKDRLGWTPFGSHIAKSVETSALWKLSFNKQFDFGLITLETELGKRTFHSLKNKPLGYWGSTPHGEGTLLEPVDPSTIRDKEVNVCGYPNDKCGAQPYDGVTCPKGQRGGTQFIAHDKVIDPQPAAEPALFYHNADAREGQSGGPIWRTDGLHRYLIGIESSEEFTFGRTALQNVGVRITAVVLAELSRLGWRV